ncbi:TonB-dependent receptor [Parasphingorhabdus halotolerans]|uniref:TonB-dependent receptor n=1 Tax=Parasphingorhabdus halotolerans TaxID=2725558 RepID=A0A6H2DK24_9SPHN|nr:TonB-dependent receptor [Parasphingorhabdus halotolerans]QJB68740.1 TonB-dependent receptor [Parasphingorhabdus halotolerans]
MKIKYLLAASVVSLSAVGMIATPAAAQQITSGIEGTVRDDNGNALAGATVVVTDTRTGAQRSITTGSSGQFRAESLTTGGPYSVTATASGFEGQTLENVTINLQGNTQLGFTLSSGSMENVIVVTGERVAISQLAIGPGQSFGEATLEAFPSITRDIRDFIRIDPRVSLDRAGSNDRVSCLGGNDRSNSFSVDGIIQSDVYGLNGTPFASRNSLPLPFDVIAETSVEFAPYDVQYSAFTGCAINVVTKAGQNDFHGSAFFTYSDRGLQGDNFDGQQLQFDPFNEKRYGATLSGPIIPDHLFFSFGYEEAKLGSNQVVGPIGSGFGTELAFVTEAQFNNISDIVRQNFGIESGGITRSLPESNRRFFGRLDWVINDQHRLEATYQRLDEASVNSDDVSTSNRTYSGNNTFYTSGTKSNYYSARLYSNWTDRLSTEIRASRAEVQDLQDPIGGGEAQNANPIPRIVVGVTNPDNGQSGSLVFGPGFSRTANDLKTEINQYKFKADLEAGNHNLTLGAELNDTKVFNLFVQNANGTYTFANAADLQAGRLACGTNTFPTANQIVGANNPALCVLGNRDPNSVSAGFYGNYSFSGDVNDAAANWRRGLFSVYAQDEWKATDQLTLVIGARVDWLDGDAPAPNPNFLTRYGFTNANAFSKVDPVLMPRFAATYDLFNSGFLSDTQVRAGVGLFTGGDPSVWLSNAFQNNGFGVGQGQTGVSGCVPPGTQLAVPTNGSVPTPPTCAVNSGINFAARGLGDAQSTSPEFKTPTVLRANFGLSTTLGTSGGFFSDWKFNFDYIFSRFRNPADFADLSQVIDVTQGLNGFTVDGRPIYRAIDPNNTGCNASLTYPGGVPPVYTGVNAPCFATSRDDEIQLTNGADFNSHVASVRLAKRWNSGVITDNGSVSFNLGYAWTKADNNRYNASSTATSSYDIVASFDRQNNAVATSEYESRHNITWAMNFREEFFSDFATQLGFVFVARSGRPYSVTFDNGAVFNDSASGNDNALLYVPTGPTDPNVVYVNNVVNGAVVQTAAQAQAGLDAYINGDKCLSRNRGMSIARNSCRNDWFFDLDMRISQDLPGPGRLFGVEDKIQLFADFNNLLNLIDSGANLFRSRNYTTPLITGGVDNQGRYVLKGFSPDDTNFQNFSASLWRIQLGVRYEF